MVCRSRVVLGHLSRVVCQSISGTWNRSSRSVKSGAKTTIPARSDLGRTARRSSRWQTIRSPTVLKPNSGTSPCVPARKNPIWRAIRRSCFTPSREKRSRRHPNQKPAEPVGKPRVTLRGHADVILAVAFHPDGKGFSITARPMTDKEQRRYHQWNRPSSSSNYFAPTRRPSARIGCARTSNACGSIVPRSTPILTPGGASTYQDRVSFAGPDFMATNRFVPRTQAEYEVGMLRGVSRRRGR